MTDRNDTRTVGAIDADAIAKLAPAQMDVFIAMAKGLSNKEIGCALGVSKNTVQDHLKTIFKKLAVSSRVEAAVIAAHAGLV